MGEEGSRPDEELSDEELVDRFRVGDTARFEELVRRHQGALKRLILRYVKDEATANDLAQASFLRAWQALPTLATAASFRAWLFRIGVHGALDHIRGNPQTDAMPVDDVAAFTHSLQTSRLVAAEVWRKVSAHLEHLPPKQRLVLELRIFHDLSFAEISAIADCTEESARVNFHHAVQKLRGQLGPLV